MLLGPAPTVCASNHDVFHFGSPEMAYRGCRLVWHELKPFHNSPVSSCRRSAPQFGKVTRHKLGRYAATLAGMFVPSLTGDSLLNVVVSMLHTRALQAIAGSPSSGSCYLELHGATDPTRDTARNDIPGKTPG